ncbi:MAG: putative permease [Clostridia bacterium]|nr:putative permease [Clostridia bacterium]
MDFFVTFNQILILFMLLLVGFITRKLNIVDASFSKNLSNFLFNITLPAMIIHGMNHSFSAEILTNGVWLIVISFGILAFSYVVAVLAVKWLKVDNLSRNIYQFGIMFSNFGFMGYPVVEALFGEEGILYVSMFSIPIHFLFNSLGIMVIKRGESNSVKMEPENVINPPFLATIAGLFIFVFSLKIPEPITMSIKMIGSTTTPLSMILSGLILANARPNELFSNYKVYIVSFIRLIFLPVIVLFILKAFHLNLLMIGIPVVITAMPVAANASILAEKYDGNAYLGAQSVFISTLLSVLTIPIIAYFIA